MRAGRIYLMLRQIEYTMVPPIAIINYDHGTAILLNTNANAFAFVLSHVILRSKDWCYRRLLKGPDAAGVAGTQVTRLVTKTRMK